MRGGSFARVTMRERILLMRLLMAAAVVAMAPTVWGQPPAIPQDGVYAPPTATIDASDFYSEPLTLQEPSLIPDTDPFAHPGDCPTCDPHAGTFIDQFQVHDRFKFEYTYLGDNGSNELGLNEAEVSATFALPNRAGVAPLLITPGAAVQWWEGPTVPPSAADMPPRTYSLWLEAAWHPQVTPWFGASLNLRPGIYTDFDRVTSDSIRIKGSGLAIFTLGPRWQIAAGAIYLDRNEVKLLPAFGFVWTPSPDVRWEVIFPQPKLAQRLVTYGNTDLWWYVGAEYGGDNWTILRTIPTPRTDQVDYNDIRVFLGFEWKPCGGLGGWSGYAEVGYVFDRELVYLDTTEFNPSDTVMLRAGLKF